MCNEDNRSQYAPLWDSGPDNSWSRQWRIDFDSLRTVDNWARGLEQAVNTDSLESRSRFHNFLIMLCGVVLKAFLAFGQVYVNARTWLNIGCISSSCCWLTGTLLSFQETNFSLIVYSYVCVLRSVYTYCIWELDSPSVVFFECFAAVLDAGNLTGSRYYTFSQRILRNVGKRFTVNERWSCSASPFNSQAWPWSGSTYLCGLIF